MKGSIQERFDAKWTPEPFSGCWLWFGAITSAGYGCMMVRNKPIQAHRIAWELFHDVIPAGLHVLHRCDVRHCVCPSHLFLGTNADNARDKALKKRARTLPRPGEKNPAAKLTAAQVSEIRNTRGRNKEFALKFGISLSGVRAARYSNWKHLPACTQQNRWRGNRPSQLK